jgi:hypothetical protein
MPAKTPTVPTRLAQVGAPTGAASAREHPSSAPRHDHAPTRFAVLRGASDLGSASAALEAADPWTVPVAVRDRATGQRTLAEEIAAETAEAAPAAETAPSAVDTLATPVSPLAQPEAAGRDEEARFLRWLNISDDMVSEHKDETGWEEGRVGMLGRFVDRLRQPRPR